MMFKMQTLLFSLLFFATAAFSSPIAKISLQPDSIIEIGEEVFLSAALSTGLKNTETAVYEWDFGDGYALKKGFPTAESSHTGLCCTHIFMKPGKFKVMLRITDSDKSKDSTFTNITIQGETPLKGFELWHAPFHARIAQYIFAQIPASITSNVQNKLTVTIRKKADSSIVTTLLNKAGLQKEEKFLLKNAGLALGNYYLLAELFDASQKRLSYIKEAIAKPYNGAPKVGINEDNSIVVNGKLFFPVAPWLLNIDEFAAWGGNYVNSCYGEGWCPTHTTASWLDYVTTAGQKNLFVIGPSRWEGSAQVNYEKNSNPLKIVDYVNATKDKAATGMWMWKDEPNLGGRDAEIPAEVLDAWTYLSHTLDAQHPVTYNLYGFDYLSYYDPPKSYVDYIGSETLFGGKKHFCMDITGSDIYPIHFGIHESLKGRRVMAEFALAFDRLLTNNYNLIPAMNYIEVQDIGDRPTPPPTPDQIIMESWISIVHGAKGINWFQYFGETPKESFAAMGKFYKQILKFGDIILGSPTNRTLTNTATALSNRVDCMLREKTNGIDTTVYLFAVRLTEPDGSDNFVDWKEPESLTAKFTISGVSAKTVTVEDENRTITVTNGSFTDTFKKNAVHIYRIGKDLGSPIINKSIKLGSDIKSMVHLSCAPFKTMLNLLLAPGQNEINFYSLQGKLVSVVPIQNGKLQWATPLIAGTYLYKTSKNNFVEGKITLCR